MRLPKSKKSRIWAGVAALTVLAVIAFGVTAFNLWQDGNAPSASDSKNGKKPIPDGPSGFPTIAGATPTAAIDPATLAKNLKNGDPFGAGGTDNSVHTVTLTFTSDGAAYLGYKLRGGQSDAKVVSKSYSVTRSVHGPLPVAYVVVQALSNATYATCTITIDGAVTNSETAKGRYNVIGCIS